MFRICLDDECHKIDECQACERNVLIICFILNALMFGGELYYGLLAQSCSAERRPGPARVWGSATASEKLSRVSKFSTPRFAQDRLPFEAVNKIPC